MGLANCNIIKDQCTIVIYQIIWSTVAIDMHQHGFFFGSIFLSHSGLSVISGMLEELRI